MGISLLTAFQIKDNPNIRIDTNGPDSNGQYSGWITFGPDKYYRPLLTTEPIYGSKKEAISAMEEVVKAINELDLLK